MKILITRPRNQADSFADALALAGFEPVFFPVIEIRPFEENVALDRAIAKLNCYDWIVFTSVNGVDAFFKRLPSPLAPLPGEGGEGCRRGVRVAAIGPKTAHSLKSAA
jgi:uroporphyrinogen-III synthase